MGITDTARAKARAAVSKAEAEVIEIKAELAKVDTAHEGAGAAGELLDSVKGVALVGSLTQGMRDDMGVEAAKLQAEADRLRAELSAAQTRLDLALKAQAAVLAVVGEGDEPETPVPPSTV